MSKDVLGRGYAPSYDNSCVCLLRALSCIDDVVAFYRNCCDNTAVETVLATVFIVGQYNLCWYSVETL